MYAEDLDEDIRLDVEITEDGEVELPTVLVSNIMSFLREFRQLNFSEKLVVVAEVMDDETHERLQKEIEEYKEEKAERLRDRKRKLEE